MKLESQGGQKTAFWGSKKCIIVYAGQYFDSETGLHYNYHRYYDPQLGRYLRADPIGLFGGINPYTYASADPINAIDPLGLAEVIITTANGVQRTPNPGGKAFIDLISKSQPGSITSLEIHGHATETTINLSAGYNSKDVISLVGGDIIVADLDEQSGEFLTKILKDKLAKNAEIYLNGCDTASGDKNITQALSEELPANTIIGNNFKSLSTDEFFGMPVGGDFRFAFRKHYKDGSVIKKDRNLRW